MLGRKFDVSKYARVEFGSYIEASYDHEVTNDMSDRTHGCIALGPSGNIQGSVKCFDLLTGKVVVCWTIRELPIPDRVLRLANHWGKESRTVEYGNKLEFLNRLKEKFDWITKS